MSSTPEASPTPPQPEESEQATEPPPTESDAPSPHQTPPRPMPPAQIAHHPYTGPVQVGPPPPDWDLRDTRWDRPEGGAAPLLVLLVAAVAIFGGVAAFFTDGVGIGLTLTGIGMVSVPLLMAGRDGLAARLPGAILIAGLWSVAAIRDSGWIVTLCAVTALLLTPLALAPQRRFTGTIAAAFGYLEGLGESFRWTNRGRRTGKSPNTGRNLRVIAITAILLMVFGGLFAAADKNFANLLAGLVPDVSPAEFFLRMMLTLLLFPLLLLWAYMAVARPRFDPEEPAEPRTVSRFEIAVPLGALNLLFALFIVMQARTYFGGEDFVMETAGLTFAEYARRGFWQLSVVAVLALAVVAVAAWKAPRRRRSDRWVLRVLLGALCAMSLVVVGSAMFRMSVYFETFGLTRLRLWVFTVEIWLAVLFGLVLVCCWKLRAWWLPQGILASGVLVLLGLAAVNPDGIIARYNIERFETTGKLDVEYLRNLSADAVPALLELPDEERECVMRWGGRDWDDRPLMAWNLGFDRAAELKADFEHVRWNDCRDHIGPGYDEPRESVPGPSDTEAGAAEPDQTEPIAGAAFFGGATCDRIDMTAADEMFGTGAKGEFGTEPDPSNLYGTVTGPDDSDGEAPYAELHCGYFGIGTGYVALEVELWASPDWALTAVEGDRTERLDNDYEVDDLDSETMAGYTAVFETANSSYTEYQYWFAIDEVTYRASVIDGPINDRARSVCEDLTGQLVGAYTELA